MKLLTHSQMPLYEGKATNPIIPAPIWNKHLFLKEFFVSPF